jgi:hypothetical protein
MRVRVKVQPSGLINGVPWPDVGEEVELPDSVAEDMAASGWVEHVKAGKGKAEKRPASKAGEEQR